MTIDEAAADDRHRGPVTWRPRPSAAGIAAALVFVSSLVSGSAAGAQTTAAVLTDPAVQSIAPLAAAVDHADRQSQLIAAGARSPTISDGGLRQRIDAIPPVERELADALTALEPRLQSIDARLAELGPAPAPTQPAENPEVAQERQTLVSARGAAVTEIKLGRLVAVEVRQLADSLVARRRSLFSERLWRQDRSPLDPRFWRGAGPALAHDAGRVMRATASGVGPQRRAPGTTGAIDRWLAVIAAILIAAPLRWALDMAGLRLAGEATSTRLRQSMLALWLIAIAGLTMWGACVAARGAFPAAWSAPPVALLGVALLQALTFAAMFAALGRGLIAARLPAWRLAPLSDPAALRLRHFPLLIGLASGATGFLSRGVDALGLSEAGGAAIRAITIAIEIGVIAAALAATARAGQAGVPDDARPDAPVEGRSSWVVAALAAWLALIVAAGALALGYLALATFVLGELIWVGTILALLFVLIRFVDDLFPALAAPTGGTGSVLRRAAGVPPALLEQVGMLLSGFARLALLSVGWAAILAPFGAETGDIFDRLTSTSLVFHLGQAAISPGTIFGGLLVFAAALAVTRGVRRWLEQRYLPTTALDLGARSALAAGVGYTGAIVAIVVASSYLGLSLDRITLFASALSVGIGFGLQSIIGNFVSGLILLAERPVKVGDWIAIGDLEGDVKRISVRATEIEMRDRSKLIVPNSDLVSKTVRNVTHGSSLGRIKLVLRVDDDTDVAQMRGLLDERMQAHASVLADPPASVFVTDVADGAIEFTAFAYVASPRDAYRVRSDLLFAIVPALKDQGISLANSAPVVNVGVGERPIEPSSVGDAVRAT